MNWRNVPRGKRQFKSGSPDHKEVNKKDTTLVSFCFNYLAYSTALVSRMTFTLMIPG